MSRSAGLRILTVIMFLCLLGLNVQKLGVWMGLASTAVFLVIVVVLGLFLGEL